MGPGLMRTEWTVSWPLESALRGSPSGTRAPSSCSENRPSLCVAPASTGATNFSIASLTSGEMRTLVSTGPAGMVSSAGSGSKRMFGAAVELAFTDG